MTDAFAAMPEPGPDDEIALVCARVVPFVSRDEQVPGTIVTRCSVCDHEVWMAPSGQDLLLKYRERLQVLCVPCGAPKAAESEDTQIRTAPGAEDELRASLNATDFDLLVKWLRANNG